MRILILPRYEINGPSSRYRFFQYLPYLKEQGWEITINPLLGANYVKHLYEKAPFPLVEIVLGYFKRMFLLLRKGKYDIIWVEQEAFPWIPSFIEKPLIKSKTKLIADYDDAFFHRYDLHKFFLIRYIFGKKIDMVMSIANLVLAGNEYLSDRAKENNSQLIEIFPTVVDTNKFVSMGSPGKNYFTIGWIGSPSTKKYLFMIEEALKEIYNLGKAKITLVGAGDLKFKDFPTDNIDWDEQTEVEEISKFDVGIMPLVDGPFERGKCGLKLIQYLSCGIPVIGSPVGVNNQIIQHGINGFKADTVKDWTKYLRIMKEDSDLRKKMGIEGRKFIVLNYSLKHNSSKLISLFESII